MKFFRPSSNGIDTPHNPDADFLDAYRNLLFGQFRCLPAPDENDPAWKQAAEIVALAPEKVTWPDLYRLETALIQLEPEDLLLRRAWTLRNEFKSLATTGEYKDYLDSEPPEPKKGTQLSPLRADLIRLQQEINWRYLTVWAFEAFRSQTTRSLCRWGALICLLLIALTYFGASWAAGHLNINLSLLGMIVGAGVLGGLVSTLRRVQEFTYSGSGDLDMTRLDKDDAAYFASPVFGGVFALLLFCFFAGNILQGDVLPKVTFDSLTDIGAGDLVGSEVAKLLIWSFIAGFAEKFVPDRLERLTQDAGDSSSTAKPPTIKTGT